MLTLLLVAVVYVGLLPIERRFGAGRRRPRRANVAMIAPVVAAALLTDVAVVGATAWGDDHGVGVVRWSGLSGLAAVIAGVVLLDLVAYLGHRVRHQVPVLWALHRCHHTDTDFDVTTGLRNHPLDVVVLNLSIAAGIVVMGAPPAAVAVSGVLSALFGPWDHAGVLLPARVDRALATVVQTPNVHRMHHSPWRHETDSNYGLVLTCWDRLFRSFTPSVRERPVGLDVVDLEQRQSLRAMLAEPWRRPTARALDQRGTTPADVTITLGG